MKSYGLTIILLALLLFWVAPAKARLTGSHNIDTNDQDYQWAWNDIIGWLDFDKIGNDSIEVRADELRGWADSDVGPIIFNCATTPAGDVCAVSSFKVINNSGALSGWAWNDTVGWISFSGNIVGGGSYGVSIVPAGDESFFSGWAWNDVVGWISFSCENQGLCVAFPTYKIQTSAGASAVQGILESNVFYTNSASPFYNYILWRGNIATGTSVQFQIATSVSPTGPWVFDAPVTAGVNQRVLIGSNHQGEPYIKYRLLISSDNWQNKTPVIKDVIINYAP